MKVTRKFDYFAPVFYLIGIVMCVKGLVSWWTFLLIVLGHIELSVTTEDQPND